jgi:uncharacterized protein YodC (DUF2158 family)
MTDKDTIKVGDIVHLKSGGPRMTVEEIEHGAAKTVWSVYGTQIIQRETFKLTSLWVEQ